MDLSSIGQDTHLSIGEIFVAQGNSAFNDFWEMGMKCRFAIARKGQYVGCWPFFFHLAQLMLEGTQHLFLCWHLLLWYEIVVETTLTIDTVKRTAFAVARQEIDAQRHAKTATVYRTKYGGRVNDRHDCDLHFYKLLFAVQLGCRRLYSQLVSTKNRMAVKNPAMESMR